MPSDLQCFTDTLIFSAIKAIQAGFREVFNYTLREDIYATLPTPFATATSLDNSSQPPQNLRLLDSSEAGQSLPLWTQIQPARSVDFIIAWDADEDAHPVRSLTKFDTLSGS